MDRIHDLSFGGERPLFGAHDTVLENITITDGESGIKCCHDLECHDSKFYGKYPWWHVDRSLITSCYFAPESRSAIWYSNDMKMKDCVIDGPKFFREMHNLELENVTINDADETFWRVDGLKVKNVTLHQGTYPFMFCKNVYVDGLTSDAKYVFQYCENVEVHNAKITTKDSFWECTARTSSWCVAISVASSHCAIWIISLWWTAPSTRLVTAPLRTAPILTPTSRARSPM